MVWVLRVKDTAEARVALSAGRAPVDVGVHQDVWSHREPEEFLAEVRAALPNVTPAKANSRAQCLRSLVREVRADDLVIVHGHGSAFTCVATGEPGMTDGGCPALQFKDAQPLTDIPEDIRNSLKAHIALSRARAPQISERLHSLRRDGVDTMDGVLSRADAVGAKLSAQDLAHLVSDLLETDGYRCRVAPPGPDGGVDIYAGKGLLGLGDSLLVQVKSGRQVVSAPVVYQIFGNMTDCCAKTTLIVSWSGFTAEAHRVMLKNPFKIASWSEKEVLAHLQNAPIDVKNKWHILL